jgi:hypothetical protein
MRVFELTAKWKRLSNVSNELCRKEKGEKGQKRAATNRIKKQSADLQVRNNTLLKNYSCDIYFHDGIT